MAGGASMLGVHAIAGRRPRAGIRGRFRPGRSRHRAGQDPRHQDDPHGAESDPAGRRQGRDDGAGARRLGLRDVHAAGAGRPDGDRAVSQAVSDRAQRRRDRGHLAVELRELLLAQRAGAVQCDERRRHRAVGHQGQARRHAALSAARRQSAARRGLLLPRERRELRRGRGERAARHGAGLPSRPRAGGDAGAGRLRRAAAAPAAASRAQRSHRSDESARDLGAGALRSHAAEAVRTPAHEARRRSGAAARRARAGDA